MLAVVSVTLYASTFFGDTTRSKADIAAVQADVNTEINGLRADMVTQI